MRTCKCMDQRDGSTTVQLQQQNKQNNQCGQSGQNTKSRRRRNEDKKNRGRTVIGGGRGALTSVCATSVHLPPRMPAALGLLASNHVFLVISILVHSFSTFFFFFQKLFIRKFEKNYLFKNITNFI